MWKDSAASKVNIFHVKLYLFLLILYFTALKVKEIDSEC